MSFFLYIPPSYSFNQPDLGLFLFDVGSDIYNGKSFIDEGNTIWGSIILAVMAVPATVAYVAKFINAYSDKKAASPDTTDRVPTPRKS